MSKSCIKITNSYNGLFSETFPSLLQSYVKMTKTHLKFDLEIYKEQQNDKVYHLFSTRNLCIRLEDVYCKLVKEENFCKKYNHLQACC